MSDYGLNHASVNVQSLGLHVSHDVAPENLPLGYSPDALFRCAPDCSQIRARVI
jgi:hypothetical protein